MFFQLYKNNILTNLCSSIELNTFRRACQFNFLKKESRCMCTDIKRDVKYSNLNGSSVFRAVGTWMNKSISFNFFYNEWNIHLSKFKNSQINYFSTKNIRGRLFYKRRPKQIPKLKKKNWRSKWLEGAPQKRGICLKVRVQTPKKPNSGLKKIARVRLSTGRIVCVYIPGIGHNLNTHSIILVRGGRCKDIPGCNYKAIRGVYDLLPVKNRFRKRSKYGVKLSEEKRKHLVERLNFKPITIKKDIEEFNKYKWFNYVDKDKNLREKPLEPDEPVPINMFHFNTYYRNKKLQQSGKE